ncbi:type IV pilin [Methanolacinia paynteri]|uniref:type IV pilin n=1 Tax=Methanolacinia paynteri TaxID=230356 RepID=UPI0006941E70|nr:type IV pilin N-terminal domain-containing protein [Methanolacinia paynteri]
MMKNLLKFQESDCAVSPVVGVMLMLVVTIIIAAVVSGFAGGLIDGGSQKTPTLSMDVSIANSGTYHDSGFHALVTGVSEPINTSDLKLITSWTTTVKTNTYIVGNPPKMSPDYETTGVGCILGLNIGTVYHGGAEVLPGVHNTRTGGTSSTVRHLYEDDGVAPFGSGAGVEGNVPATLHNSYPESAYFGNYILEQGTVMTAEPIGSCQNPDSTAGGYPWNDDGNAITAYSGGYGQTTGVDSGWQKPFHTYYYQYKSDSGKKVYTVYTGEETVPVDIIADDWTDDKGYGSQVDNIQAVLGCGWENLRSGDTVNVKLVYIPTGKTILDKDVVVSA